MYKKKILIIILICLAATIIIGKSIKENIDYIHTLETLHQKEMHEWVINQRGFARSLDREIAEMLAASDEETIRNALSNAYDLTHKGRESLWRPSLIMEVNHAVDRWGFATVYDNFRNYLYYLKNKENQLILSQDETRNLELMRSYAEIIYKGFNEIIPHIQYEEELTSGMKTLKYYSWKKILNDKSIIAEISNMGIEISDMPRIGDSDNSFKNYLDSSRAVSNFEYGLIDSGEDVIEEKILAEKAYLFIDGISSLNLFKASVSPNPGTKKTNESENSGYGRSSNVNLIGDYYHYNKEDKAINVTYDLDMTRIGGHILNLNINQKNSGIDDLKKAVELGEKLINQWKIYEGVKLELIHSQYPNSQKEAHFVYAVVKEDVLDKNKIITLYVALGNNQDLGIDIDAFRYLDSYNYPVNYKPELTPEEAISSLSLQLTAAGVPKLEINNMYKLVYSIPVTGVKWVNLVYINALTGKYEGMEYDYTKP